MIQSDFNTPLKALRFFGRDTRDFLQAQLSCDMAHLTPDRSTTGLLLLPNGKVNAMLTLVHQGPEDVLALLDPSVADSTLERLRQFRFRAKVEIESSDLAISITRQTIPTGPIDLAALTTAEQQDSGNVSVSWPGAKINIGVSNGPANAVNANQWRDHLIQSGIVPVSSDLSDAHVPMRLNFDWLNCLSFDKGCYPGQEIVARTRHLGRIKRRTFLVSDAAGRLQANQRFCYQNRDLGQVLTATCDGRHAVLLAPVELAAQTLVSDSDSNVAVALNLPPYRPVR